MIDKRIFRLTPRHFTCPVCGKKHFWDGKNLSEYTSEEPYIYECNGGLVNIFIEDKLLHVRAKVCSDSYGVYLTEEYLLDNLRWDTKEAKAYFKYKFYLSDAPMLNCNCCDYNCIIGCNRMKFYDNDARSFFYNAEIEFEPENYFKKSTEIQTQPKKLRKVNSRVTLKDLIFNYSLNENISFFKEWFSNHINTFRWLIPILCIYFATKILNSGKETLTIDSLKNESRKKLGVTFDCLKNKDALKELLAFGSISVGFITALKLFSRNKKITEISVEDVDEKLEKVENTHRKFNFTTSKIETILPIAISVIILYLMTRKPEWLEKAKRKASLITEDISAKATIYLDLAKLFISDKLHIDLEDKEQVEKAKTFILLACVVVIAVIIYGKGILGERANISDEQKIDKEKKSYMFIQQIIGIMKKIMPSAFAALSTYLVTKNILKAKESKDEDS